ncbi:hypothetical protein C2U70_11305 [Bradyrhizobium guangdongense]|uniref:hypothetical protein n=1 Tax=Bradyrhizobium guangdongense TaxID=1325090 RepID=UPI0016428244|nr:hypothetical protein [Bradyrhizobium guangdongense]TPQ37302.1 hypothetical protein C2U70_11305 [Bradyrhizobium guangdongense]
MQPISEELRCRMLAGADNLASGNGRASAESLAAAKRLQAIGDVARSLDAASIKSREDAIRALCVLELANKCIRIVLRESQGNMPRNALIEQSDRLIALIDTARTELGKLDRNLVAVPGAIAAD